MKNEKIKLARTAEGEYAHSEADLTRRIENV
jgi:hypothetical protein